MNVVYFQRIILLFNLSLHISGEDGPKFALKEIKYSFSVLTFSS